MFEFTYVGAAPPGKTPGVKGVLEVHRCPSLTLLKCPWNFRMEWTLEITESHSPSPQITITEAQSGESIYPRSWRSSSRLSLYTGVKPELQVSARSAPPTSPALLFRCPSQARHTATSVPLQLWFPPPTVILPHIFSWLQPSHRSQLHCHLLTKASSDQPTHGNHHLSTPCHCTWFGFLPRVGSG